MSGINPKADFYFQKAKKWEEELARLRTIALDCGLTEEVKWGVPCYMYQKHNIVLIHDFKEYCAFLFFKGALLKDPNNILVQQTENVQAARQIRFSDLPEISENEHILKSYILQAIEVEKAGLKVPMKKTAEFKMSEEFQNKLEEMPELKTAFEALTPGRQRGYHLYFTAPKLAVTRVARVEKSIPQILSGKGLED